MRLKSVYCIRGNSTLRDNFDRMALFASQNDAVVIQPLGESHFYSDLLSWESINGIKPEDVLPAILITTIHPKYFHDRDNKNCRGEPIPEDELIFLSLKDSCKQPADVLIIIEKIFSDIKEKKEISNFQLAKRQKAHFGKALVDSVILEPNFSGIGIDLKKLFSDVFSKK